MREILFRGKRVSDGEWVYGSLHIESGETDRNGNQRLNYRILGNRGECDYVTPETVGQYTGKTVKNGKVLQLCTLFLPRLHLNQEMKKIQLLKIFCQRCMKNLE